MAASAAQIAVKTTAGASINTGIWAILVVLVTTVGGVALAIVKEWGPWKKGDTAAREADFARLRADIDAQNARSDKMVERIDKAEAAAKAAEQHASQSDAKLQAALTACELMLGLVEREMPDATEIKIVKRLLANAASADMGIGDGIRRLAAVRGVGEA